MKTFMLGMVAGCMFYYFENKQLKTENKRLGVENKQLRTENIYLKTENNYYYIYNDKNHSSR